MTVLETSEQQSAGHVPQPDLMKLCRFQNAQGQIRVGLGCGQTAVLDLGAAGIQRMESLLESPELMPQLAKLAQENLPKIALSKARMLAPVENQEVWAAGVTYLRSKKARKRESDFSAMAYEMVYLAPRPELFFKSLPEKVSGPMDPVGIRQDAFWSVPEAELALVLNSRGEIVGCTLGNDMSARDIEGHNLLYLPQAKVYDRSCAIGPWIVVGIEESVVRTWKIHLEVQWEGEWIFRGATNLDRLKRSFDDLVGYLRRSQTFPHGVVLLTGTGIIPPDGFRLKAGDLVQISVEEIGILANPVVTV